MKKLSIKAKITLWYTLIMLLISAFALFVMLTVSRETLIKDSARKLTSSVERTVSMINSPNELPPRNDKNFRPHNFSEDDRSDDFRHFPGFMFFENGVHTAVYNESGEIEGGAIPFEFADEIEFADSKLCEKTFEGNRYLTYAKLLPSDDGTKWVVGVISVTNESMLLKSVSKTNIILIAILLFVAALGGYLILKQAFKPVDKISGTAKFISESRDLSQRISLNGGNDEIHRLADTFDEMLDKIEKTLEKEKQFTSDASHELRTPVAVILSECEYTLECAASLDEAKESVLSVKKQSEKMSKLISELLAISRMDNNTLEITLEETDISELLNFVCDEQEDIQKNNITLTRSITPDIRITTDSMLLARIFINLISNAYSYGKENGNIKVSLTESDKDAVFTVTDDGIGISEENLPKIWERFYQVNPSRTNESGSMGLGLSIVKLIADKLGATLNVESTPGAGSTFSLLIPKNKRYSD